MKTAEELLALTEQVEEKRRKITRVLQTINGFLGLIPSSTVQWEKTSKVLLTSDLITYKLCLGTATDRHFIAIRRYKKGCQTRTVDVSGEGLHLRHLADIYEQVMAETFLPTVTDWVPDIIPYLRELEDAARAL